MQEAPRITLKAANQAITGVVKDANGRPVPGASVGITAERQPKKDMVRTDRAGKFMFEGLVKGEPGHHSCAGRRLGRGRSGEGRR